MRLAATLTTMRDAARQPVAVRGTLRDSGERPCDVVILDVSTSGFRAEVPRDVAIEPGTRVRIAASAFGVHDAIAVRNEEGGSYGFAFTRAIPPAMLERLAGEQPSTVMPFPGVARSTPATAPVAPATVPLPAAERATISARASLAIMVAISCALWIVCAAVVAALSLIA